MRDQRPKVVVAIVRKNEYWEIQNNVKFPMKYVFKSFTAAEKSFINKEASDYRRSYRRCSIKIGALRIFAKFTGTHLCQSLFFNRLAGLRSVVLLKQRLWFKFFTVDLAKFLRASFCSTVYRR